MNLQKLKNDPFYYDLYEKYGEQFIKDAGYFESDATEVNLFPGVPCTPVRFMNKFIDQGDKKPNKYCVLVTTGSFAPIHSGHVDMMLAAQQQMENKGYTVLGGYFCPDHDAYITEKLGDEAMNIHERVKQIELLIRPYTHFTADPWMGLYCNADVNFTVVIDRLKKYIKQNLHWTFFNKNIDIEIVFVCGEDRINFASTFMLKGRCVVVRRSKNMDAMLTYFKYIVGLDKPNDFYDRVLFDTDNTNYESSTNIRNSKHKKFEKKRLILRYDSREDKNLNEAIIALLKKYYYDVKLYDIAEQEKRFEKLKQNLNIISLDPLMKGDVNIEMSREYDYYGFKFLGYVKRPNESDRLDFYRDSIYTYLYKLNFDKNKEYWLFDDDICGGSAITFIRHILEETMEVKIAGVITFIKANESEEVMDIRDLIIGHPLGGLVVNNSRVPYIHPYVDSYIRASINNPTEFSKAIQFINDEHKTTIENFQEKWRKYLEGL